MAQINLRDYLKQLDLFVRRGNMDEAIAHASHILGRYPKNAAAYRYLASALMGQSQWQEALEVLHRLAAAHIDDVWVQTQLGFVYGKLKQLDSALYHYERAFDLAPNDANIIKSLRDTYSEKHNKPLDRIHLTTGAAAGQFINNELYDQAIHTLLQTLKQLPDRPDLKLLLAKAYWEADRYVDAAEQAFDVLKTLPYCVTANTLMAELWLLEQRPSDAQRFLSRVEDVEPYLAVEIATNERAEDGLFVMDVLNYQQYAQQTLAEQSPDWLESLAEGDQGVEEGAEEVAVPVMETAEEDPEADNLDWLVDLDEDEEAQEPAAEIDLSNLFGSDEDDHSAPAPARVSTGLTGMLGDDADEFDISEILGEEDNELFRSRQTGKLSGILNKGTGSLEEGDEDVDDIDWLIDAAEGKHDASDAPRQRTPTGLTGMLSKFEDEDEDDDLSWLVDAQTGRFDSGKLPSSETITSVEDVPADVADEEAPEEDAFDFEQAQDQFDEAESEFGGDDYHVEYAASDLEENTLDEDTFDQDTFDQDAFDQDAFDQDAFDQDAFDQDAFDTFDADDDDEFADSAQIDTSWFQGDIEDSQEDSSEQPAASDSTDGSDPLAWMNESGAELADESERNVPQFFEDIGDDEVSIGPDEQDSLAWLQASGIELSDDMGSQEDYDEIAQNFTPTSRLDSDAEEDGMEADPLAWLNESGVELSEDARTELNDETTPEVFLTEDEPTWDDDSALDEFLMMENLTQTGMLARDFDEAWGEEIQDSEEADDEALGATLEEQSEELSSEFIAEEELEDALFQHDEEDELDFGDIAFSSADEDTTDEPSEDDLFSAAEFGSEETELDSFEAQEFDVDEFDFNVEDVDSFDQFDAASEDELSEDEADFAALAEEPATDEDDNGLIQTEAHIIEASEDEPFDFEQPEASFSDTQDDSPITGLFNDDLYEDAFGQHSFEDDNDDEDLDDFLSESMLDDDTTLEEAYSAQDILDQAVIDDPTTNPVSDPIDWQDDMPDQSDPNKWEPEDNQQDDNPDTNGDNWFFNDEDDGDDPFAIDDNWLSELDADDEDELAESEEELATNDADWLSDMGAPAELRDEDAAEDEDAIQDLADVDGVDWFGTEGDPIQDDDSVDEADELVAGNTDWLQDMSSDDDDEEDDSEAIASDDPFADFDSAFGEIDFSEGDPTDEDIEIAEEEDKLVAGNADWLQDMSGDDDDTQATASDDPFADFDSAFGDLDFSEGDESDSEDGEDDLVAADADWLQDITGDEGKEEEEETPAEESLADFDSTYGQVDFNEDAQDEDDLVAADDDWLQDITGGEGEEAAEQGTYTEFDSTFGEIDFSEGDEQEGERVTDADWLQDMTSVDETADDEEELAAADAGWLQDMSSETDDEDEFAAANDPMSGLFEQMDDDESFEAEDEEEEPEMPRAAGMTTLLNNIQSQRDDLDLPDDLPEWGEEIDANEFDDPSWLASVEAEDDDSQPADTPTDPEWLTDVDDTSMGEEAEEEGDWLDEMAASIDPDEGEEEAVTADDLTAAQPDWLEDFSDEDDAEEAVAAVSSEEAPAQPDWLSDMDVPDPEATAAEEEAFMSELEEALSGEDEAEDVPEEEDYDELAAATTAGAAALGMVAMDDEDEDQEDEYQVDYDEDDYDEDAFLGAEDPLATEEFTSAEEEELETVDDLAAALEEETDEGMVAIGADNAPDWLNQLVPGLDLDFEARDGEEDESDDEGTSEHRRRTTVGESPSEDEFGWLVDIVEEETQAGAPPPLPTSPQPQTVETPRFQFSSLPVWARSSEPPSVGPMVTGTMASVSASQFADETDDFDDNYDPFQDNTYGADEYDTNEMRFDDLDQYGTEIDEEEFAQEDDELVDDGTIDDLLDDMGLDLDLDSFDFDDLEDDDDEYK